MHTHTHISRVGRASGLPPPPLRPSPVPGLLTGQTFHPQESCSDPLSALPLWLAREVGERCEKCEACGKIFSSLDDLSKHLGGRLHKRKMVAMNSAGGRRKEKRRREKEVKDELKAEELVRVGRPKNRKELRIERKKARRG